MTADALNGFLAGGPVRPVPQLPAVEPLAARIGGVGRDALQADATVWGNCLVKAGRLLGLSGLVMGFDSSIAVAAAAGGDPLRHPEFALTVEACERLVQTQRDNTGCVAAMSGPLTLARSIYGQDGEARVGDVKPLVVAMAEALCKARPHLLLLREGAALGQSTSAAAQRKVYNTLKNMAAYFSVPLAIFLEDYDPALLPEFGKLRVPFVLLGADRDGQPPALDGIQALATQVEGLGLPLPFGDPEQARDCAAAYRDALGDGNYLYTAMQELSPDMDLEAVLALVDDLGHQ
ncbi:hypothetical protein [Kineobactrum salinum]|uniref:Uncharacterized protein n=1 Tax=Kineobactrum salinum TaxID=2708301 RepID=A0A6C0U1Q9_9GAMM|nr:hypothetical protein [Kineobactrum salinum]QIB66062.1 hypothetical protein G3T16_12205 [Kineobactrum salinum]